MKITVLGSGTSHGVPMIGCRCAVCLSTDPRDTRTRPSVLIDLPAVPGGPAGDAFRLLVDTSTDFRQQALRERLDRIDAVFYTHAHADHIFGFDELRRFNHLTKQPLSAYGDAEAIAAIRRTFAYAYDPAAPKGGGVPDVRLWHVAGPFAMHGHDIVPVTVLHGTTRVLGLRIGGFAYLTDCNAIPASSMALLEGLDVLVLDALRRRPHPTHFCVDGALEVVRRLQPRRTFFTHIAHDLGHAETCASLPEGVSLAYDGLVIECR